MKRHAWLLLLVVGLAASSRSALGQIPSDIRDLKLRDWQPQPMIATTNSNILTPAAPVFDVHNHLGGGAGVLTPARVKQLLTEMDAAGIRTVVNLDGGWDSRLRETVAALDEAHPGRFVTFALIDFNGIDDPGWSDRETKRLEESFQAGAKGLKFHKTLGLGARYKDGRLVPVDDPKLDPIWATCGKYKKPVLIHTADPGAFFTPLDNKNERWHELNDHPNWLFHGNGFPARAELHAQRLRVIERHPSTTFICAHLGNDGEDLAEVGRWLDRYPNMLVEFGARISELGRQPYAARRFLIRYQDRVLFGSDTAPNRQAYRIYFRFLESDDEYFDPAGGHHRQGLWMIYGVFLPRGVLEKIYHGNADKLFGISASPATARATESTPGITWKKTVIEGKFRSEGVAIADVNRDGKTDVLIGDSWYEAPAWVKHDIRKPGDYGDGLHKYSDCMTCWADDVNGDGWVDEIVVGFPGVPALWYENPRGKDGYWPKHEAWHSACNETPLYTDLFGDGRRVLVMGWQPKGKDNEGQMAWFTPGSDSTQSWEMHPISKPSRPGDVVPGTFRFSHGLGVGDLNGDGRKDVICTDGWWEQPAAGRVSDAPWPFHRAKLGDAVADMIAYDVNHDGKADVIDSSAHQFGIWWYEQGPARDGSPVFTRHNLFPDLVSETHALIAADINKDGLADLVTGKRFWSHGRSEPGSDKPARLYWFEARRGDDGTIGFTPRLIDDQSGIGTQFVVADFNGDGLLDIVTSNKKGVFLIEQVPRAK